jgi:hypothetical protein
MNQNQKALLTKRFQTTMIGALFEFEKTFGYLWGQHKNENEPLTQSEIDFGDLWENVRNNVLNNGNNQLRKTIADLSRDNTSVKYNYKFYPRGDKYDN